MPLDRLFFGFSILLVFFFQAEDGIRDTSVTGVQTCALPIWAPRVFDGQPSPHHLGQTARHGEPEPGTEPRVRVEALERLEDARPQLWWDAGPMVDHPEPHVRAARLHADDDGLAFGAVSHRVGEQVDEDLLEPHGV